MISNRRFSFAIALPLLLILPASAGESFSVGFPMGEFNVINGEPCLLRPGEHGPAGYALDIKGTSLVHYGSEKPLAYPLRGTRKPVITLGKSDGVCTSWDLSGMGRKRQGPIRAAEGMFKGWYLDWSESETEVVFRGKTLHTRKLILVENPKAPREFRRYEVGK
jgi:hypothetical protein